MAEIKVYDGDRHRVDITAPPPPPVNENTGKKKKNRVASVDVFRGLTKVGNTRQCCGCLLVHGRMELQKTLHGKREEMVKHMKKIKGNEMLRASCARHSVAIIERRNHLQRVRASGLIEQTMLIANMISSTLQTSKPSTTLILTLTHYTHKKSVLVDNNFNMTKRKTKKYRLDGHMGTVEDSDDAGGEWPVIGHAPWDGCNLADFVMPFFLFIVGIAIALALKRIPDRRIATKKVILRTLKLIFWGLLLQGGYSHAPDKLSYGVDMKQIRWCGILQRIALAYFIVGMLEIATQGAQAKELPPARFSIFKLYLWHWLLGACVLIVYLAAIYGTHVPTWQFTVHNTDSPDYGKILTVACDVRGKLDPPCNAVGYIDRQVLGINHMYPHPAWKRSKACTKRSPYEGPFKKDAPSWCWAPFEPEGILRSTLVVEADHLSRLTHWILMGLGLLVFGIILHFTDGGYLEVEISVYAIGMDWYECNAGLRYGS
ncbi:hypothetical protein M8C21_015983 [Ambrosia artemisiifolia]|uniref:Heparan-alpha-glucosaminide N-acetyltransferase catalytic domain-containing protein n=1 Tax=Ambrosia artemisiifolia TaxID=4212 RepID=A0AAD5CIQ0_AMBAR|nr:hypothetical protein M8C21_015983 [Ambrosia artemisiifolia]